MATVNTPTKSPVAALIGKLISGMRYPWLVAVLAGLFLIDFVILDPIPMIDEAVLAVLTLLAATWRTRDQEARRPAKDVTPPDEPAGSLHAPSDGREERE